MSPEEITKQRDAVAEEAFYAYLWLREDGSPYYIGKGKNGRAFDSEGHFVSCPKDMNRIIVQYYSTEKEAFAAEIFLISFYGRKDLKTGCLRNLTSGGIGGDCYSNEAKIALSKRNKLNPPARGKKRKDDAIKPLREYLASMTSEERSAHARKAGLAPHRKGKPRGPRKIGCSLQTRIKIATTIKQQWASMTLEEKRLRNLSISIGRKKEKCLINL